MAKGKGRGKGRGKESVDRQRQECQKPGTKESSSVQISAIPVVNAPCQPNKGKVEHYQTEDAEYQLVTRKGAPRKHFSANCDKQIDVETLPTNSKLQRLANPDVNAPCQSNKGKVEHYQSEDAEYQLVARKGAPRKHFSANCDKQIDVETLPTNSKLQRSANPDVNAPCQSNKGKVEHYQSEDEEYQLVTRKGAPRKHFSGKQTDVETLPTNSKLRKKPCDNEIVELKKTEHFFPNRRMPTDVSQTNDYAKCATSLASNFHQLSLNTSESGVQAVPSKSFSYVGDAPRKAGMDIVRRPNFGSQGREIALVANYFLLKGNGCYVYHYDVDIVDASGKGALETITIKEEKEKRVPQLAIQQKRSVGKDRCREIITQLIKDKSLSRFHPFYDGHRNLYSLQSFLSEKRSAFVNIVNGERPKSYKVTIQPANKNGGGNVIDLTSLNAVCESGRRSKEIPHEAIMAFDMILCHRDPPLSQVAVGRSFFFFSEMRKNQMEGQLEIWKGYNQSTHLTQRGPAVVVNLAAKAFRTGGFVIEHCCGVLGFDITNRRLSPEDIHKISKSLSNVKIEVTHLPYPRRYTVMSVTKVSARNLMVDIGGRNMSVAQFFSQKYKTLRFPDLPCLAMRSTGKPTYTPMEFCIIPPGQPNLGKLDRYQTADMMNKTAIPPTERFQEIEKYVRAIAEISGPLMQQSGMRMELSPLNFTARVISPPALAYKNEPSVKPDTRGVWRIDGRNFTATTSHAKWVLISFARQDICPRDTLQSLSSALVQASTGVGLCLNLPVDIHLFDRTTTTFEALRIAKSLKVDFAFVVLSRNDKNHNYEELKFIADVKIGLITQCMEDIVVPKCCGRPGSGQILNNLLSKLNIKLGGINHTFSRQPSVSMRQTIVMGADAAHSPRGSRCPSIAAVVGSVDDVPFQYAVSCRVQMNPDQSKISQEIILDMKDMTKHILSSYRERNNTFPEKIIFFRDGVSEGQFETVLKNELNFIQKACHELLRRVLPVTFIVVQKRHQTRFMPRNPRDGIGRGGNVPPGTTVDTDVVHPVYFDYFLCSHEGIKGTSKPAHYVVLHDDNKFQADELQKFCYELCHVYARCNRSISIPAPAMNAHLAAARAKKYIEWHISKDTSSSSGYSDGEPSVSQEVINFVNNISMIKAPMFFV